MAADPSMRHYFAPLFEPASVAVVGASEQPRSVGSVLIENMLAAGYRGQLYAVNPKHREVRGVPCFPAIGEVPRRVDLAVIATPAPTVPGIIEQCGAAGVRAAVVISAGFSESGPVGAKLERALLENARRHRLRVLGPNCLGIMRPDVGLNATFARGRARPGSLGLIVAIGRGVHGDARLGGGARGGLFVRGVARRARPTSTSASCVDYLAPTRRPRTSCYTSRACAMRGAS